MQIKKPSIDEFLAFCSEEVSEVSKVSEVSDGDKEDTTSEVTNDELRELGYHVSNDIDTGISTFISIKDWDESLKSKGFPSCDLFKSSISRQNTIAVVNIDAEWRNPSTKNQQPREILTTQVGTVSNDTNLVCVVSTDAKIQQSLTSVDGVEVFPTERKYVTPLLLLLGHKTDCVVDLYPYYPDQHKNLPLMVEVLVGHFLQVDINPSFSENVKRLIRQLVIENRGKDGAGVTYPRLHTDNNGCVSTWEAPSNSNELYFGLSSGRKEFIPLDLVIEINGQKYRYAIGILDTVKMRGFEGLGDMYRGLGFSDLLLDKNLIHPNEKRDMSKVAILRPQDFLKYAINDLNVYKCIVANREQELYVYNLFEMGDMLLKQSLTIGRSVSNFNMARDAKILGIMGAENTKWDKLMNRFYESNLKTLRGNDLKQSRNLTSVYGGKVEGGRCTLEKVLRWLGYKSIFADIDGISFYTNLQRTLSKGFGNPLVISFPNNKKSINKYPTIFELLKLLKVKVEKLLKLADKRDWEGFFEEDNWGELVPGLWFFKITNEQLKYPQNMFPSWVSEDNDEEPLKCLSQVDTDEDGNMYQRNIDYRKGNMVYLKDQILKATLTNELLENVFWLWSDKARHDFLHNTKVVTATIFLKSQEIVSGAVKELEESIGLPNEFDLKWVNGQPVEINMVGENKRWIRVEHGKLTSAMLDAMRKIAKKQHGSKSPQQTQIKLISNTSVGVAASQYFNSQNVVFANNVTGNGRARCWLMASFLGGFQSITDGCVIDLNKVPDHGRRKLYGTVNDLYTNNKSNKKFTSVGGYQWTRREDGKILATKEEEQLIFEGADDAILGKVIKDHLVKMVENIPLFMRQVPQYNVNEKDGEYHTELTTSQGSFEIEVKNCWDGITTFRKSDYRLYNLQDYPNLSSELIKARGYKRRNEYREVTGINEDLHPDEAIQWGRRYYLSETDGVDYNHPVSDLIRQLSNNPKRVKLQSPAVTNKIISMKEFRKNHQKYDKFGLSFGDNWNYVQLLNEFSLSSISFLNLKQRKSWTDQYTRLKMANGWSYERYFMNADGTLNFFKMVEDLNKLASEGVTNPVDILDPGYHKRNTNHPFFDLLKKVKVLLSNTETEEDDIPDFYDPSEIDEADLLEMTLREI